MNCFQMDVLLVRCIVMSAEKPLKNVYGEMDQKLFEVGRLF